MEKSPKRHKQSHSKPVDKDIYKKIIEYEEKEARSRTNSTDAARYLGTCKDIKKIIRDIHQLKCSTKNKSDVVAKRLEACKLISKLKKLNRLQNIRLSESREAINLEKQKVESKYMHYQNLLYEVHHYDKQYRKCMLYRSRDEDINLITTQEFMKTAPADVTQKFAKKNCDQHELYLARLHFELKQRINLAQLLVELKEDRKTIKEDIVKLKKKIDGLDPKLADVIAAAKPLQEYLDLNITEAIPEHKLSSYLPIPLYLLYCSVNAYQEYRGDGSIALTINGDVQEWVQFNEAQLMNEDSDCEQDSHEGASSASKKHRRRKCTEVERDDEIKKSLLQKHPLNVEVSVKGDHMTLKMQFYFLTHLRIITVVSESEDFSDTLANCGCAREVLTGESILSNLYANDNGTETPNIVNQFQLSRIGVESFQSVTAQLGYAYKWAQKICGMEFLNFDTYDFRVRKKDKQFIYSVEEVFKIVRLRLSSRPSLALQLTQLEQNVIPTLPSTFVFPKSTSSALTKFTSVPYQRFCMEASRAERFVDADFISENVFIYLAVIARPGASLNAWIIIKPEYPDARPFIVLDLKHKGEFNSDNSDEVRDMEMRVNTDYEHISNGAGDVSGWQLALQLRFLCAYFDIYLETHKQSEYPNTTVYFHAVSGRNRRRPFKYHKPGDANSGVFSQY